MTRKYLMVLAFTLLFVIYSIGFAMAKSSQQEPVIYVANFNYTPDSQETAGSAGVTFAIGNVNYKTGTKLLWFSFPQFKDLDKAIKDDLSEIFTAKGFSVRGPFDSYDLIPYPEKKGIDLYLIPTIELSVGAPDVWPDVYSIEDIKIEVSGKMTLELREIVTRELMWIKTIPFTKFESPFTPGVIYWKNLAKTTDVANKKVKKYINSIEVDSNSAKGIAKGLEKQYPDLMATITKLIDSEEMKIIKKQCEELKSKK